MYFVVSFLLLSFLGFVFGQLKLERSKNIPVKINNFTINYSDNSSFTTPDFTGSCPGFTVCCVDLGDCDFL